MRSAVFAIAELAGCSFTPGRIPANTEDAPAHDAVVVVDAMTDAAIDAPPPNFHLHLEADIDGRSNIIFKGTTVKWHHYQFAAPGREGGTNFPTRLDAVDWLPTWPDDPDAENRNCDCDSLPYTQLPIGIPRAPSTTTLSNKVARVAINVVTEPAAANDYTLELELTDVGATSSATYEVDIDVVVQP